MLLSLSVEVTRTSITRVSLILGHVLLNTGENVQCAVCGVLGFPADVEAIPCKPALVPHVVPDVPDNNLALALMEEELYLLKQEEKFLELEKEEAEKKRADEEALRALRAEELALQEALMEQSRLAAMAPPQVPVEEVAHVDQVPMGASSGLPCDLAYKCVLR